MLLNDLFIVEDWQTGSETLVASLMVRVPHRIFEGHFPGRPVLPGACLVQLVQELAPTVTGGKVRMVRADQVKFVAMIDPVREASVRLMVTGKRQAQGEWRIIAEGVNAGAVCFRFKGIFQEGSDYAG